MTELDVTQASTKQAFEKPPYIVQGFGVRVRRKTQILQRRIGHLKICLQTAEASSLRKHRIKGEISALEFAVETIRKTYPKQTETLKP